MEEKLSKFLVEECFSEATFNREQSTIENVVLLGSSSKNNHIYTEGCKARAVGMYEGAKAFVNHPSSEEEKTGRRDVRNLAGQFTNPRFIDGKIRATFKGLNNESGKLFVEIAESMPNIAGMSHNAIGKWRSEDGKRIVEDITRVFSVDLVADPAQTQGMFESEQLNSGDEIMEWNKVTKALLLENCPDIHKAILEEGKASLDGELKTLKESIETLKKENDEFKVKESVATKAATVNKLLEDAKLPKDIVTGTFRETLEKAEDETGMKALIEDRKKLFESAKSGVINMGGESNVNESKQVDSKQARSALLG